MRTVPLIAPRRERLVEVPAACDLSRRYSLDETLLLAVVLTAATILVTATWI